MATVLLAIGDGSLREACSAQLEAAGHAPLRLERPLAPLLLSRTVIWDAVCVDASALGNVTLKALAASGQPEAPILGLGLQEPAVTVSVPLPLAPERLLSTLRGLERAEARLSATGVLRLDHARRRACSAGREVALTRTEFLLLQLLHERRPREVAFADILQAIWGSTEGRGTSALVRAHVRNLRLKLERIGLKDVIRNRRGRGYALWGQTRDEVSATTAR